MTFVDVDFTIGDNDAVMLFLSDFEDGVEALSGGGVTFMEEVRLGTIGSVS